MQKHLIKTFLLVCSLVKSKQLLCFVHGQGKKSEQNHTKKNFVRFHNHSLYELCQQAPHEPEVFKTPKILCSERTVIA